MIRFPRGRFPGTRRVLVRHSRTGLIWIKRMDQERTMEEILREIREICANEDRHRPINREPESPDRARASAGPETDLLDLCLRH
jgi:hypothetical protein